jgi:Caspase domain
MAMTTTRLNAGGTLSCLFAVAVLLAGSSLFAADKTEVSARGPGPDLKKLRALLVIDTADELLKDSVTQDKKNMENILTAFIPESMCEITVLEGKKVTRQAILDHYRTLKTGPDESLLFFYAGHGAMDAKERHLLQLQEGKIRPIFRDEVVQAMKARKPGLIVLLTDCCSTSNTRVITKLAGTDRLLPAQRFHPVVRCLFFQHRGLVNITAAQDGTGSWGDNRHGGVFTQSLCTLLKEDLRDLDKNKDHMISWKEFFEQLQRKTQDTFEKFCETMRTTDDTHPDIKKLQRTQKPRTFGPLPEPVVVKGRPEGKTYAVVSLVNKTGKVIAYKYRWGPDEAWKDGTLKKDGKAVHETVVLGILTPGQLPKLEVDIPSEKAQTQLRALKWTGTGKPLFKDGNEIELSSSK